MLLSEHVHCVAITFKITERAEQQICIKFCVQLEQPSMDTIQMIQKAFRDDTMSAAQIKVWHKWFKDGQNMLKVIHVLEGPWNQQITWWCWTCTGCNQQRSVTDTAWNRSWSGDSKNYCVQDFDTGSWHEMCHSKLCFVTSYTSAERASYCRC